MAQAIVIVEDDPDIVLQLPIRASGR